MHVSALHAPPVKCECSTASLTGTVHADFKGSTHQKPHGPAGEASETLETGVAVGGVLYAVWLLYILLSHKPTWYTLTLTWWVGAALGGGWLFATAGKT